MLKPRFHRQKPRATAGYAGPALLSVILWVALLSAAPALCAKGPAARSAHDGCGLPGEAEFVAVPEESPRGMPGSVSGQDTTTQGKTGQKDKAEPTKPEPDQAAPQPSDTTGSWLFAPIPINSPAIGAGLEWAIARVFPLSKKDEISPPSAVGIGGVFTNNGSRAFVMGGRLYVKEDKYRFAMAFGKADVNLDIYGIGKAAGDNGTFVPLKTEGKGFLGEALYGLKKGVYIGLRGQYRNLRLSLNPERMNSDDIAHQPPQEVAAVIDQIGEQLFRQQTVSLGPRFQWDSRDNVFYPKRGVLMDVNMDLFSTGLGSKWSYQYYKFGFNKYIQVARTQVLAFRGMACAAAGDRVPIYDLCLFGVANDIRGYSGGRYQDRRMFATQGEYRLMLPLDGFLGRFGVVAFGGFGAVGSKFSDIGAGDLMPGGGAGARFRLIKKHPINFRVDYGIGRIGHTLNIGVLEAF